MIRLTGGARLTFIDVVYRNAIDHGFHALLAGGTPRRAAPHDCHYPDRRGFVVLGAPWEAADFLDFRLLKPFSSF